MNNFLKIHLNLLKKLFLNPELELRILINKSAISNKKIFLSNFNIDDINLKKFNFYFKRRINREPISKIFNNKSFWKYDFFVNNHVLDPRPETEIIIEKVLEYFPEKDKPYKILDMCTGSGCLAISLSKEYKKSIVTATDISKEAIKVAKFNAKKLNCMHSINFITCDLFNKKTTFDIIVSNPPYLSEYQYQKTSPEIKIYEPKIALLASHSGFEYYLKIANILPNLLTKKSFAFLEIGSSQAKKALNIFKLVKINCQKVEKDLKNLNRVIILNKS